MTPNPPGRQVCPLCGFDDFVELTYVAEEWVMTCSSTEHQPMEWRPKDRPNAPGSYRSGIGQELGVYDDLLDCVVDGFAEYGVIEHRFSVAAPDTYRFLVDRYGHTARGPSRYTASAFLGGALGQLWREGLIDGFWTVATGYWKYNSQIGAYGPVGTATDSRTLEWATFAENVLHANALDWPALNLVAGTGHNSLA